MKRLIVVQYEQFFETDDGGDIAEAMREGLEALRTYGGARVVGSYETEDDTKFRSKALTSITIGSPITITID